MFEFANDKFRSDTGSSIHSKKLKDELRSSGNPMVFAREVASPPFNGSSKLPKILLMHRRLQVIIALIGTIINTTLIEIVVSVIEDKKI